MPYPQTQQLETRQTLLIDIYDVAHTIQSLLDPVLQPAPMGLYLPDQLEPVLKVGHTYWYEKQVFIDRVEDNKAVFDDVLHLVNPIKFTGSVTQLRTTPWQYYHNEYVPVTNFQEVTMTPWDVVDVNPTYDPRPKRVILAHHLAPLTSLQPNLPVQAIQLVLQLITNEIDGSRAFRTAPPAILEEIVLPFLQTQYQGLQHIRDDRWFQDTLTLVYDALLPILNPIRDQLRHNPYQMCAVQHHHGYQLRVEQMGDYRIMAWEQITADPDYQRWLQAKANGDWDRYVSQQEEIIANNVAYIATSNPYR